MAIVTRGIKNLEPWFKTIGRVLKPYVGEDARPNTLELGLLVATTTGTVLEAAKGAKEAGLEYLDLDSEERSYLSGVLVAELGEEKAGLTIVDDLIFKVMDLQAEGLSASRGLTDKSLLPSVRALFISNVILKIGDILDLFYRKEVAK